MKSEICQKSKFFTVVAGVMSLALSACGTTQDIPAPTLNFGQVTEPEVEDSVIAVPIELNTLYVAKELGKNIPAPAAADRIPLVGAEVKAMETTTQRVLVREKVEPGQPGRLTVRYRREQREVEEDSRCFDRERGFLWTACKKKVWKTVLVPFVDKSPATQPRFQYSWRDAVNAVARTFDTSIWLDYKVHVTSLDVQMHGKDLDITGEVKVDVAFDYQRGDVPLGPNLKRDGFLNGSVGADVGLKGTLDISEDLALDLALPANAVTVKLKETSFPFAIAGVDLEGQFENIVLSTFGRFQEKISEAVTTQLIETLSQNPDQLNFGEQVETFVVENAGPRQLPLDVWLVPNPSRLSVSQPVGSGTGPDNAIEIDASVVAQPIIAIYSQEPPYETPSIAIDGNPLPGGINVYPRFFVEYNAGADRLRDELNNFIEAEYPDVERRIADVNIYPSDEKIVFALSVMDRNQETEFVAHLWGEPVAIPEQATIALENVEHHLAARNPFYNSAAWLFRGRINEKLKEHATFSYAEERDKLFEAANDFKSQEVEYGTVTGNLEAIDFRRFDLLEKGILIQAFASGNAAFVSNEVANRAEPAFLEESAGEEIFDFEELHAQLTAELAGGSFEEAISESAAGEFFAEEAFEESLGGIGDEALSEALLGDEDEKIIPLEIARALGIIDDSEQIVINTSDELRIKNGIPVTIPEEQLRGDGRRAGDRVYEEVLEESLEFQMESAATLSTVINPREIVFVELPCGDEEECVLAPTVLSEIE